jgi:hypothetical protein
MVTAIEAGIPLARSKGVYHDVAASVRGTSGGGHR